VLPFNAALFSFAQSHKATKKKARADRPVPPSTARLVARSQRKTASRLARHLRGFVALCEKQLAPRQPEKAGPWT
jgi:hypothetical protein